MTSQQFCYWLMGYLEMHQAGVSAGAVIPGLTSEQMNVMKRHLDLVFIHEIDPQAGGKEVQDKLNKIHNNPNVPLLPDYPVMRC